MSWAEVKRINSDLNEPLDKKIVMIGQNTADRFSYVQGIIPRGMMGKTLSIPFSLNGNNYSAEVHTVQIPETTVEIPTGSYLSSMGFRVTYFWNTVVQSMLFHVSIDDSETFDFSGTGNTLGSNTSLNHIVRLDFNTNSFIDGYDGNNIHDGDVSSRNYNTIKATNRVKFFKKCSISGEATYHMQNTNNETSSVMGEAFVTYIM